MPTRIISRKTPLIALLTDEKTNKYANTQGNIGWRVDCIGDLGFWAKTKTAGHTCMTTILNRSSDLVFKITGKRPGEFGDLRHFL
jgi:hypothetical protein